MDATHAERAQRLNSPELISTSINFPFPNARMSSEGRLPSLLVVYLRRPTVGSRGLALTSILQLRV